MKAVVLAGGRGRRLGPFTMVFPKPLAPIGEMPIIDILVRQLARHGVEKAYVSVGYLGPLIEAYFATQRDGREMEIEYLRESRPLGTAGPVRLLADADEAVLVLNGDVLTTFDFSRFMAFFGEHQPALAIGAVRRATTLDFGVIEASDAGEVAGFLEKPTVEHLASVGINIFSPRAIAAIDEGERIDVPALVLRLLERGERVLAFRDDCYWMDIGQRDDYERALSDFPEMRSQLLGTSPEDAQEGADSTETGSGGQR